MSIAAMRRSPGSYVLLGLAALVVLLLLLKAIDTARTMAELFGWPFQFDESEGMIVVETLLLDQGRNIFAPVTNQQFVTAPYPPLFYLLNWPGIHFAGATFKVGRIISLLATGGSALLIFLAVYRPFRNALAGAAGALAWLALALVGFWGVLVKPDVTAVFFGLAGLVVALYSDEGASARVWWALPLFWAAFYTKQTAIAPALAVCVWLLLLRWRTGLRFTLILLAGAIVPSLLLNLWTDGGYFYHELTLHDLPWQLDLFLKWLFGLLDTYWPLLVTGSLAVIGGAVAALAHWLRLAGGFNALLKKFGSIAELEAASPRSWAAPVVLMAGYWAAGLVVAGGSGTYGGNHNHFLEWAAGSSIGFGLLLHALMSARRGWMQAAGAVALLLLAIFASPVRIAGAGFVPWLYNTPEILAREFRPPPAGVQEGWNNMAQYVSNTAGGVYSTDISLLIATGKWRERLWTTDPFTQTHATYYGRWDEKALLEAIRAKQFALIALPFSPEEIEERLALPDLGYGDVSHGIMQAVRDAYQIDQRNVRFIYKPKP